MVARRVSDLAAVMVPPESLVAVRSGQFPMTTRKPKLTQAQKSAIPKLAKLKEKGLFKGNVRRPSKYAIKQTKVYEDVITGKATVVKVNRATAVKYKEAFRVKGTRVVVNKGEGETVRYSRKTGEIVSTRKQYGKRIRKRILPIKPEKLDQLPKERKGRYYTIPFNRGSIIERFTFESMDELRKFMSGYEDKWPNWEKYVEVEEIESGSIGGEEGIT